MLVPEEDLEGFFLCGQEPPGKEEKQKISRLVHELSLLQERQIDVARDVAKELKRRRRFQKQLEQEKRARERLPRLPKDGDVPSVEDMREWGRSLWVTHERPHARFEWDRKWSEESRQLELHELEAVRLFVDQNSDRIACQPHNAVMGFGFGMSVYLVEGPFAPGLDPEVSHLFTVTSKHLVFDRREDSPFADPEAEVRSGFETGWRLLSPLTHNETNKRMLALAGLPPLHEKHHYDY